MKKLIYILLCGALSLSLVACNGNSTGQLSSSNSDSKDGLSNTSSSDKTSSTTGSSVDPSSTIGSSANPSSVIGSSSTTSSTSSSVIIPTVNNYEKTTYNLAEITDYVHVTGRSDVVKTSSSKTGLLFDYAAQGLLFKADCEGDITVSLELKMRATDTDGLHYYTVYIDGVKQNTVTAKGTPGKTVTTQLKVASGLKRGVHTIEVYRNHEACSGIATLLSVTMNGLPQKWVSDPNQLRIEFLGDSITSGTGVHGKNGAADQNNIKYNDGTATYAFVASRILGAEASLVSCSGLCIASNDMYKYYDKLSCERDVSVNFDHSKMDVDLYVIALGTNDTSSYNKHSDEQITKDVKTALASVRKDHPNAKILWVYGQLSLNKGKVIKDAVNAAGGEAAGLYFYCCKKQDTSGSEYHPSAEAQQRDGEEVAAYIKTILNLK